MYSFFRIKPTNEFRKSRTKNWNNQYVTRLCSKEACDFINSIGSFGKYNWKIPKIIMNSDNKLKCLFVKGFFDSEGEIDKKSRRVGATSVNLSGLEEIGKLLTDLGIRYTITSVKDERPNTSQKYRIRIQDRKSVELFDKNIGFTIERKQERLNRGLSNYKFTKILPEKLDKLRDKILSLRKDGISYENISNKLNLSLATIWRVCNPDKSKDY